MSYYGRNIFRNLDDLPDKPRLAINLLVGGLAILGLRFGWQRVAPSSFNTASMWFFLHFHYLFRRPSPSDFGGVIVGAGVICLVSGCFIFLRRGFWWVAERREEKAVTELKFK
jgi:hypothetical protein